MFSGSPARDPQCSSRGEQRLLRGGMGHPRLHNRTPLLSCPGGLQVVLCPQQMTCHLLLAPRAPLGLALCPCPLCLPRVPQVAWVSPLVQHRVSPLCHGRPEQGLWEGVRARVCVHLAAPHLAEDGLSSPKETHSISLCEGIHTPSIITASVLEGGLCGQVINEFLAKASVTEGPLVNCPPSGRFPGPQWVIVTPSAGHWSDWDPACVVKDMAVGKSRGNLDAAPATAQRANHRLYQVPGG